MRRGAFGQGRVVVPLERGLHVDVWTWPVGYGDPESNASAGEDVQVVGPLHEGAPVLVYSWREAFADGTRRWRGAVVSDWRPPTASECAEIEAFLSELERGET